MTHHADNGPEPRRELSETGEIAIAEITEDNKGRSRPFFTFQAAVLGLLTVLVVTTSITLYAIYISGIDSRLRADRAMNHVQGILEDNNDTIHGVEDKVDELIEMMEGTDE